MAFASGRDIGSESIRGKLDNLIKSRGKILATYMFLGHKGNVITLVI